MKAIHGSFAEHLIDFDLLQSSIEGNDENENRYGIGGNEIDNSFKHFSGPLPGDLFQDFCGDDADSRTDDRGDDGGSDNLGRATEPAALRKAMTEVETKVTEAVLIARNIHMALEAVSFSSFSSCSSFMALIPRGWLHCPGLRDLPPYS